MKRKLFQFGVELGMQPHPLPWKYFQPLSLNAGAVL